MTVTPDANSTAMILYDDARARDFEPFATSRPLSETRSGALLVRERWEHVLGMTATGFVSSAWLERFAESDAPPAMVNSVLSPGTWLVNSRALPHLGLDRSVVARGDTLSIGGRVAALRLKSTLSPDTLREGSLTLDALATASSEHSAVDGTWLDEVWDMIATLTPLLVDDIPRLARDCQATAMTPAAENGVAFIGKHAVWIEAGAVVEPFVTFDTSAGPILLRRGSQVQSFTRVVGPCYVGEQSTVMADRIANSSIGPVCRVHGEVSSTIFIGYANKGHDGFVGHSVLGRWVNLGAGTITSNLKNTYGEVSLWTPTGTRGTGQQFLGTLFGDHVKTGIGLTLTTGCVLGAGANVFERMPPKHVRPFSWGSGPDAYSEFTADKFVSTAERMMQRRNVTVDDAAREYLRVVHQHGRNDSRWERR